MESLTGLQMHAAVERMIKAEIAELDSRQDAALERAAEYRQQSRVCDSDERLVYLSRAVNAQKEADNWRARAAGMRALLADLPGYLAKEAARINGGAR